MVLFRSINDLTNHNGALGGPGGRRRRLFIPPSTNYPLFSYIPDDDQRSFLSLIETGSEYESDRSETASISTSRSLPSTLDSVRTTEDNHSFQSWLLGERQGRYSAVNSDEELSQEEDERTHRRSIHSGRSSRATKMESEDFTNFRTSFLRETKVIAKYSSPLIITFVLEHLFSIVCLLVVGHLGKKELAAVSLASMFSTVSFAIFEGIATALDTLCPQAYGAKNYELVSLQVQRCMLFSWTAFIPVGFLWWFSPLYFKFVVKDQEVLDLTVVFMRILILGGPPYIFFENSKRFLQAQGIFEAGTGILFISSPFNIALSWFLVWNQKYGIGYLGAPISAVINFWIDAILLVCYVRFIDGKRCWYGIAPLKDLLQQWKTLASLAVPGIVMLESEYMAYEIMTLFASYLGTTALAAQSAVSSIASLTYMVPFSISIACSTRIANYIGGHNIASAKIATETGLLFALGVSFVNCIVLFVFKRQIAYLFTDDEEVIKLIVYLFSPLVAVIQIFDGIASVSSGILRAQGSQNLGGFINFFVYYAFAIPLAITLCNIAHMGIFGLWVGIGSGMLLIGFSQTLIILNSNWDDIVLKAMLMFDDDEDSME